MKTATLLVRCPEQRGIVAKLADFVWSHGGNIISSDQHTDFEANEFLSRVEWDLEGFRLAKEDVHGKFEHLARLVQADWKLVFSDDRPKVAIFATKQDHCLLDLLWRAQTGELKVEIPLVVANRPDLADLAKNFGAEFVCLSFDANNQEEIEKEQLQLLRDHDIELVVLAKYMRIISGDFLDRAPTIINIHHSFLPAFIGDKPYHKAHSRGVKLIGATAHYVTPELDEGPIIHQEVTRVSHKDNVQDLVRRGRDVERRVLAQAVRLHVEGRVMRYGNRTAVFE